MTRAAEVTSVQPGRLRLAALANVRLLAIVPVAWLAITLAAATFADLLPLADPYRQQLLLTLQQPSVAHPLGTDSLGRDVFARSVFGLQVSLVVGLGSVALGLLCGGPLGLVAGYFRGRLDAVIMAGMAVILSFPPLILAMAIIAYAGPSLTKVVVAIGILFVPACARLIRAHTLRLVDREFVLAAKASGMRDAQVIVREILPNLYPLVLAYALLMIAVAIIGEAALSFLGLSVPPPRPSLGGMISAERGTLGEAPWAVFGPAVLLSLTVLSLNIAGDQLQRRLDRRKAML